MIIQLNLRDFLPGAWLFKRVVNGFIRQDAIHMVGKASFSQQGADLVYDEAGHYFYQQQPFSFQQNYTYQWEDGSGYAICFRDGRFFYHLTSHDKSQDIIHLCGQDQYRGSFTWQDNDTWILRWYVQGPVKNFTIETIYERVQKL
jgi:hypothetical protein